MAGRTEKINPNDGAESGASKVAEKSTWQLQRDVDELTELVDTLRAQMNLPLTPGEVTLLRTVLADKKERLGDHDSVINGIELIAKLDGFLNPPLPFEPITTLPLEED